MTVIALLARLILAGVFVVSGVAKLRDRDGSRTAVEDFGLPKPLVPLIAAVLPFVELACALLLVCADPAATVGVIASLLLLSAFTVLVIVNLVTGKQVDCHCFGQLASGTTSWRTVARNGVLLVLAAVPLYRAGDLASAPGMADDYTATQTGVGLLLAALTAAVVVLGVLFQNLMVRYGSVLLRLEAVETVVGIAAPKPAPEFALPDLDGAVVALSDVLADERPALVAFISPSCVLCSELLPDLEAWQADADHPLSVLVVSSGSVADNREKIGADSRLQVLLQDGRDVENGFGITGTPGAYLVTPDGLLASAAAYGVGGVRQLHDNVVRNMTGAGGHDHGLHQIQQRPVTPGDVVPEVTLTDPAGKGLSLLELTEEETVLLFWRVDCGYCAQIAADVATLGDSVRVALVTGSDEAAIRATGIAAPVVREEAGALSAALQIPGTPSAVSVKAGLVTSSVVVGGPDVLALLAHGALDPAVAS